MRRLLDILLCLLAAPLLLLFGALIAVCVFLDSPGPVLYRSRRIGRGGQPFSMLKFRTMRHGSIGPPLTCYRDERFTPFGRALAVSRLDELPQVINVLRGDMALVGPRPELEEFVESYPEAYSVILRALPGLTGPAQLRFSGEGRILAGSEDRVALYTQSILPVKLGIDMDYVKTASVRRDLEMLCWTLVLPARLGAHAYRAWRSRRVVARPAGATTLLVLASVAAMLVFSLDAVTGL
ncbi:MAG TPA: sugar transferase [Solirubrobacteraceae bacterium]|nr:sugar transferase [Solirubrobacteraceae bacterium]